MKPRPLLFTVATEEAPAAGLQQGASAPETPAAEAAEETPAAEAAEEAPAAAEAPAAHREPTLLERAHAAVKSKGTLLAECNDLRERAETAEAALQEATADLQAARGEIADLQAKVAALTEERAGIEAALKSVEEAAADKVATTIGFPSAALPEAAKAGETVEELHAQLAAEKDNARRYELSRKIALLEGYAVTSAN